jgi:PAT family beta-lactamase induction signal transducer AmpG
VAERVGGLLGGLWMVKLGINRALWLFGARKRCRYWVRSAVADAARSRSARRCDRRGGARRGLGTAAFTAFIARATNPRYTATQFALFTSLAAVPRTLINATTGWIVQLMGWFDFFLLCTALAVPGWFCGGWRTWSSETAAVAENKRSTRPRVADVVVVDRERGVIREARDL